MLATSRALNLRRIVRHRQPQVLGREPADRRQEAIGGHDLLALGTHACHLRPKQLGLCVQDVDHAAGADRRLLAHTVECEAGGRHLPAD